MTSSDLCLAMIRGLTFLRVEVLLLKNTVIPDSDEGA